MPTAELTTLRARQALKKKFRTRSRLFGGWTSFAVPGIADIFCSTGMDFIGICLEHTTTSLKDSEQIMAITQARGKVALPRVSSHNGEQIKRQLDSGADGIIVPMVNTPEELDRIVAWMKYPNVGRRSFGVARAQGYGFHFDTYTRTWNESSILIIQVESIQGVENINRLLDNGHVDGVMVGPYDMSGSLGVPGQLEHPKVQTAVAKVIEACKKRGIACGTQIVDPMESNVSKAFKAGHTFVILGSDLFLLWKWAEQMQALIGKTQKNKI